MVRLAPGQTSTAIHATTADRVGSRHRLPEVHGLKPWHYCFHFERCHKIS